MQTQLQPTPIHQRRAHKRYDYSEHCTVERDDIIVDATTRNISAGGVNLVLDGIAPVPVGKIVTLAISDFAPIQAVVRWSERRIVGLQFLTSVDGHAEIAELIVSLASNKKI